MSNDFRACEITPKGISIKVGTHRQALGIDDFDSKDDYIAAASAMLECAVGKNLALIAANLAAVDTDKDFQIAALEADVAALRNEIAAKQATIVSLIEKLPEP